MEPTEGQSVQLATFDPPLADAVVTVLRREGIPAGSEPAGHAQVDVTVPADRRDRALRLLADRMEAVHDLVRSSGGVDTGSGGVDGGSGGVDAGSGGSQARGAGGRSSPEPDPQADDDEDEEAQRPLMLERLRGAGYGVAALLVPLLVVTLAGGNLPAGYALAVFIGGLVAITWWRSRRAAARSE